jgi:hypothetical protein
MVGASNDRLLSVGDVREFIEKSYGIPRPDLATVYRWLSVGVAGVRLECVKIGRALMVRPSAIAAFIEKLTAAKIERAAAAAQKAGRDRARRVKLRKNPPGPMTGTERRTDEQRRAAAAAAKKRLLDRATRPAKKRRRTTDKRQTAGAA